MIGLFLFHMSKVVSGFGSHSTTAAATAIAIALILIMASPAILSRTEAFAAPLKNYKDCKDIQLRPFEGSFASEFSDKTVTIGTSQDEYSVKTDYLKVSNDDGYTYYKNVGVKDPKGPVLLPGGEPITIILQTQKGLNHAGGHVILYKHNVSDCQILLGQVKDSDKISLKSISVEQNTQTQFAKITVQVPDASDVVGEHFTKLGIQFYYNPEVQEYHLISNAVQVR
jgi:hypothetical protein